MFPTPRQLRYESLDIWRGVACLLVVLFHSAVYLASKEFDARIRAEGGSVFEWTLVAVGRFWIGVPLFFVVSGYCIAASADSIRAKSGSVGTYFVRRVRRIYPPLWAAILLTITVMFLLPSIARPIQAPDGNLPLGTPWHLSSWQWLGNATLTESWRPAVVGEPSGYVLGQLWTLCYEEQFYLVVGVILLLTRRWFFPCVWLVTGLVLFNLSSLNPYQFKVAGVFTDGLWIAFASGVAVYYRLNYSTAMIGVTIEFVLLAFCSAAIGQEENVYDTKQTLSKYNAVACLFAVLLCRLRAFDAALMQSRLMAPLRFCGRMCYSLYLTHPLVAMPAAWLCYRLGLTSPAATVLLTLPICTLLAVGLGYVFHKVVERRFLNSASGSATRAQEMHSASPALRPA